MVGQFLLEVNRKDGLAGLRRAAAAVVKTGRNAVVLFRH
jgi:hypothetical protein